jgi:hypothetical protein
MRVCARSLTQILLPLLAFLAAWRLKIWARSTSRIDVAVRWFRVASRANPGSTAPGLAVKNPGVSPSRIEVHRILTTSRYCVSQ